MNFYLVCWWEDCSCLEGWCQSHSLHWWKAWRAWKQQDYWSCHSPIEGYCWQDWWLDQCRYCLWTRLGHVSNKFHAWDDDCDGVSDAGYMIILHVHHWTRHITNSMQEQYTDEIPIIVVLARLLLLNKLKKSTLLFASGSLTMSPKRLLMRLASSMVALSRVAMLPSWVCIYLLRLGKKNWWSNLVWPSLFLLCS